MSFPETILLNKGEILRSGTIQVAPLGTRGITGDGRVFRYCKVAATTYRGWMMQQEATIVLLTCAQTSNLVLDTVNTTIGTTWQKFKVKMTQYTGNTTAMTKDNFKEGYIYVGGTGHPTGTGMCFKIKTHEGMTAASTECPEFTIETGEYPEVSFTTDVAIGICKNMYDDVIPVVTAAEPTAPVIGISPCAAASGDYIWIQTWGQCVAYCGGATSARALLSACTDAAVTGLAVLDSGDGITLNSFCAISPWVNVAGAYAPVNLCISP